MNRERLRREVREAARQAFAQVRASHPNERFYAFALSSNDDAVTIVPAANSVEGLHRRAREYGSPISDWLRWSTAEWACQAEGGDYFDEIRARLARQGRTFRRDVYEAMIGALADLDDEGFFGTGAARENVTLFCTLAHSNDSEWLENESARRLNPLAVYEVFRQVDAEDEDEDAG